MSTLIIFRYLAKEVLQNTFAVAAVMLLIVFSARFIRYLSKAATGSLSPEYLFSLMGYMVPSWLMLILPLSIYVGILLAYGRFYVESEMTVLRACGMSTRRLLSYTMIPAMAVCAVVFALTLVVSPWSAKNVAWIIAKQDKLSVVDLMVAGRFQKSGGQVSFVESIENKTMGGVFMATQDRSKGEEGRISLILADSGAQQQLPITDSRYLVLEEGYRYDVVAGQSDIKIAKYERHGIKLPNSGPIEDITHAETLPTKALLASSNVGASQTILNRFNAELQWRIALPLMIPVMVLFAVPLSRVSPRQGRFLKLFPSTVIFLIYMGLLTTARGKIADGSLSPDIGLWPIHLIFILIGVSLVWGGQIMRTIKVKRQHRSVDKPQELGA